MAFVEVSILLIAARAAVLLVFVLQAVSMVGMIAYLSYLVAEHFGCSGIVAIFTCAVVMSHYALYNVPREMRKATRHTAEVFSYMCEGAIFLYVGLDTIDPVTWQVSNPGLCISYLPCAWLFAVWDCIHVSLWCHVSPHSPVQSDTQSCMFVLASTEFGSFHH